MFDGLDEFSPASNICIHSSKSNDYESDLTASQQATPFILVTSEDAPVLWFHYAETLLKNTPKTFSIIISSMQS